MYQSETKDVMHIANHFGKGYRSVISKLVNLQIYEKPNKEIESSRTVKTMLRHLEDCLDIEIEGFNLNKKSNLEKLIDALDEKLKER